MHLLLHLLGYEDAIKETARETSDRIDIDDELKIILDSKLQIITENINKKQEITVTYFIKDQSKSGGSYSTITGIVKKIDYDNQNICFVNGKLIPINDTIDISEDMIKMFE